MSRAAKCRSAPHRETDWFNRIRGRLCGNFQILIVSAVKICLPTVLAPWASSLNPCSGGLPSPRPPGLQSPMKLSGAATDCYRLHRRDWYISHLYLHHNHQLPRPAHVDIIITILSGLHYATPFAGHACAKTTTADKHSRPICRAR